MNIGITMVTPGKYLQRVSNDEELTSSSEDPDWDEIELQYQIERYMFSSATVSTPVGVDPKHLTKVWCSRIEDAKQMLEVTSHMSL